MGDVLLRGSIHLEVSYLRRGIAFGIDRMTGSQGIVEDGFPRDGIGAVINMTTSGFTTAGGHGRLGEAQLGNVK